MPYHIDYIDSSNEDGRRPQIDYHPMAFSNHTETDSKFEEVRIVKHLLLYLQDKLLDAEQLRSYDDHVRQTTEHELIARTSVNSSIASFGSLPSEIQRKIWKDTLPGPRIVEAIASLYLEEGAEDISWGTYPDREFREEALCFLTTCRMSREVFLENYNSLRTEVSSEAALYSEPCIDMQRDTLFIRTFYIEHMFEKLRFLDGSKLRHLALQPSAEIHLSNQKIVKMFLEKYPNVQEITFLHIKDVEDGEDDGLFGEIRPKYIDLSSDLYYTRIGIERAPNDSETQSRLLDFLVEAEIKLHLRQILDRIARHRNPTWKKPIVKVGLLGGEIVSETITNSHVVPLHPEYTSVAFTAPAQQEFSSIYLSGLHRRVICDNNGNLEIANIYEGISELFQKNSYKL